MVLTYSRIPMTFGYKDRDQLAIHPALPIISAANNKFIRFWSSERGELLQTLDNSGGFGEWSADGTLFLTFSKDVKSAPGLGRGGIRVGVQASASPCDQ